jgi:hypothetical protein
MKTPHNRTHLEEHVPMPLLLGGTKIAPLLGGMKVTVTPHNIR